MTDDTTATTTMTDDTTATTTGRWAELAATVRVVGFFPSYVVARLLLSESAYEAQLHRRPDWDSLVEPVYDAEDLDPTDTAVGISVRAQAVTGQLLPLVDRLDSHFGAQQSSHLSATVRRLRTTVDTPPIAEHPTSYAPLLHATDDLLAAMTREQRLIQPWRRPPGWTELAVGVAGFAVAARLGRGCGHWTAVYRGVNLGHLAYLVGGHKAPPGALLW
jgi:hypothetical protein